jgi:3-deoxy-7-phosphoheptulonate synthase
VGGILIGGQRLTIIAGPCAVENRDQLLATAVAVKAAGAQILRGGAFKPRTSPYDFQGLGEEGLRLLAEAGAITGMPVITEVTDSEDVDIVAAYADILQIGSRNMSAFRLLQRVAAVGKPVLLKRGFQSTIREWLLSAEYLLAHGNNQVILCERGIRTFDAEHTRNTLDLAAVPVLHAETYLPVIVDPSHATGRADLILPMCRAAIAAGADGVLVEVHHRPQEALCDGKQSLTPEAFAQMMLELEPFARAMGRMI